MAPPNYMLALREDHTPRTMSLASTRALVTHSRHMTQRVRERQAMEAARAPKACAVRKKLENGKPSWRPNRKSISCGERHCEKTLPRKSLISALTR